MSAFTFRFRVSCAVALVMLMFSPAVRAEPVYSVADLGRAPDPVALPPPYGCSACLDQILMNGKGQLVISRLLGSFDSYYWEPGLTSLILIDGHLDDNVRAAAISASNGWVVGTSDGGVAVPFRWSRTTGLHAMCCADSWLPLGVNSSGTVVGTQALGGYRAVIWNNGGAPVYIDDIEIAGGGPWVAFQQARTISDDGIIAGIGRLMTATGAVETHYFLLVPTAGALDRSDWTVSATESSPSDPPANAIDGNINTRFSTGNAQHDSQGFRVSWPGDRTVGRIRMDVGPSTSDYPRQCGIWVVDTSGNVTFVNCAADSSGIVDVSFAPIPVQKIEVWQWGSAPAWWSIAEFNAYSH